MSELLNQKSSIQGKVHSRYLNSIFDLSGNWLHDATDTKTLAFDGYFISLYYLHLTAFPLVLNDRVKKSVPPHWDPAALSREEADELCQTLEEKEDSSCTASDQFSCITI
ncbi:hypothetical protein ES332_A06G089600v1 [Gossypium tomentosum]|uniref:MACPF domain-containing protein n=1 Tax=Gossypium tomentosum TaxID=34277 RepID=A0A5D2Q193_GOSTO|nr:hypothetical protein ES332_A06G089600v1 [Gossypium tomentosum]